MNTRKILLLVFCFVLSFGVFAQDGKYLIDKIVIDAGHGGKDPGTLTSRITEKKIVLQITKYLGSYIEKYMKDVEVIYTRKTDVFIPLAERAAIANDNQADLFISIHVNASKSSSVYGSATYVLGAGYEAQDKDVARIENSVLKYETNNSDTIITAPESHIITSLYQNIHMEQSMLFAQKIQDQFRARAGRKDMGVRQDFFAVLTHTDMPAVLVETGFLTNRKEEKFLSSKYGQEILASAIFRAFREYKETMEKKINEELAQINTDVEVENPVEEVKKPEVLVENKVEKEVVDKKVVAVNTNVEKPSIEVKKEVPLPVIDTKASDSSIVFRVQVLSSSNKLQTKSNYFKGVGNIEELNYEGRYKYFAAKSPSFSVIQSRLKDLKKYFPDAYIVAFNHDQKISISEAKILLGESK